MTPRTLQGGFRFIIFRVAHLTSLQFPSSRNEPHLRFLRDVALQLQLQRRTSPEKSVYEENSLHIGSYGHVAQPPIIISISYSFSAVLGIKLDKARILCAEVEPVGW